MKCNKCGSFNVIWFEELIFERRYKVKKDGIPYKNPFKTALTGNGTSNFECLNCGNIGDGSGDIGGFTIEKKAQPAKGEKE